MKKKLLLSFAVFATALSVNAQVFEEKDVLAPEKFELPKQKRTPVTGDDSYYYWENNSRVTSELNKFKGTKGDADGGFDTTLLYTYKVSERLNKSNAKYWQQVVQVIPNLDTLSLNSFQILGQGLNSAGSNVVVKVLKKDMSTVIASKNVKFTTAYGMQTVVFDTPATSNDSLFISLQMASVADSFIVAKSHNQFNNDSLGTNKLFVSSLPFLGDGATFATEVNNGNILAQTGGNFDFFIIPNFSYKISPVFKLSATTIKRLESVTFTKNDSHFQNPIINWIKWNNIANKGKFAYVTYNFGDTIADFDQTTSSFSHKYTKKGVFEVKNHVFLVTWFKGDFIQDSSVVTVTVDDAASLEAQTALKGLSIFPNPTANELKVSFNANSAATIELVNVAGQVIESKNASEFANVTFNTSALNAGVYFVNIKVAEGSFTQKIIKE